MGNGPIPTDYTVKQYALELSKVKILSREEELELFDLYLNHGDLEARNKLVESCLRFVVKVAHRYSRDVEHQKSLISAGNEGLLVAVDRFDVDRGTRFLSYAAWYIILYIRDEMYKDSVVPVPTWRKKSAKKLLEAQRAYREIHGSNPSHEELSKETGLSVKQVRGLLATTHATVSMDNADTMDIIQLELSSCYLEDSTLRDQSSEVLHTILQALPVREQFIIKAYYGLLFKDPLSLKQIAGLLGISSERVRQIKVEAVERLGVHMRAYGIESLDDILVL